MRRKVFFTVTITLLFVSCLPVFDNIPLMQIVNRTGDTIIVGRAYYDNIDSITYFVETLACDRIEVKFKLKEDMEIVKSNIIAPDSFAIDDARIYSGQDGKGYFYIFKYNSIKKHTWEEICKNHLYDTLVVTREMLKQGNRIEYHGNKTENKGNIE